MNSCLRVTIALGFIQIIGVGTAWAGHYNSPSAAYNPKHGGYPGQTKAQCVRELYLNSINHFVEELGGYESILRVLSSFPPETYEALHISHDIKTMKERYREGIQLRPFANTPNPKLVLACGNKKGTKVPCEADCPSEHHGDDTINPDVRVDPTVIGMFGSTSSRILPSNHYQTLLDEGPISFSEAVWTEAERVLRPGGMLISRVVSGGYPPASLNFKLVSTIDLASIRHPEYELPSGFFVIAKPFADGSYPAELKAEDLPDGYVIKR